MLLVIDHEAGGQLIGKPSSVRIPTNVSGGTDLGPDTCFLLALPYQLMKFGSAGGVKPPEQCLIIDSAGYRTDIRV
ncbi:hypothetical protein HZ326_20828 [Fusarium oxysporum f. sp. albedinis]|nr:hypothetical protein HZ326_20828 [Fusarium oxysporum f. sp. albedinis]